MTKRFLVLGWWVLLATSAIIHAQTPSIQDALDAALQKEREMQGKKSTHRSFEIEFDLKPPVSKDGKPLALGALLDRAVKNNADIRLSEMKVREAEANLTKTRLVVMQQVVLAHHDVLAAKANLDRVSQLVDAKTVSVEMSQKAKAELARAEAQLAFLLGDPSKSNLRTLGIPGEGRMHPMPMDREFDSVAAIMQDRNRQFDFTTLKPGSQSDKLREALGQLVRLKLIDQPAEDAVRQIQQLMPKVNLTVQVKLLDTKRASVDFKESVELGAVLQWFEDEFGCRFVLREYGVVLVEADRLPPGAVLVQTFWKTLPRKPSTSVPLAK